MLQSDRCIQAKNEIEPQRFDSVDASKITNDVPQWATTSMPMHKPKAVCRASTRNERVQCAVVEVLLGRGGAGYLSTPDDMLSLIVLFYVCD